MNNVLHQSILTLEIMLPENDKFFHMEFNSNLKLLCNTFGELENKFHSKNLI